MEQEERARREIAGLGDLSRPQLAERWEAIYRVPPPKGARRVLLERAIAWHVQAKAFGGMKKQVLRALTTTSSAPSNSALAKRGRRDQLEESAPSATLLPAAAGQRISRLLPSPGARLVRDWRGRTHVVDVVRDGYVWQGERYASLSVIARAITGARWSGPRFFGL